MQDIQILQDIINTSANVQLEYEHNVVQLLQTTQRIKQHQNRLHVHWPQPPKIRHSAYIHIFLPNTCLSVSLTTGSLLYLTISFATSCHYSAACGQLADCAMLIWEAQQQEVMTFVRPNNDPVCNICQN